MYLKCGVQYAFRYLEGLMMPPGAAFAYGKAVHDDTAFIHTHQVKAGEVPSVPEVSDFFDDALDRHWEDVDLKHPSNQAADGTPKLTPDDARKYGQGVLRLYTVTTAPKFRPVKVEEAFRIQIPGKPYSLVGKKDLEEESGRVIDHKSTRKSPSTGVAARSDQLTLYALPALAAAAADEWKRVGEPLGMNGRQFDQHMETRGLKVDVALNFLVALKTKVKVMLDASTRTWGAYLRLIQKADEVHEGIRKGVFSAAPEGAWWCSPHWCGFWDVCPYGGQNTNPEMGFLESVEGAFPKPGETEDDLKAQLQAAVDAEEAKAADVSEEKGSRVNRKKKGVKKKASKKKASKKKGTVAPMAGWFLAGAGQVLHYTWRTKKEGWVTSCGMVNVDKKPGTAKNRQCKRCLHHQGGN
jgi:hypothetical protein